MDQQNNISANQIAWFNKLVSLAQWDAKLPYYIARLLKEPAKYESFLTAIKNAIDEQSPQPAETTEESGKTVSEDQRFLQKAIEAPPLGELFTSAQDPFAGATPELIQLLAEVSDVTPDLQSMVYSRNGTFQGVVEVLRKSPELDTESLILDGLNKFLTLLEMKESIAKELAELAASDNWYIVMASLRDGRDYVREEDPALSETWRKWNDRLTPALRKLIFKPDYLSRAPRRLISMAYEERQLFQDARALIPAEQLDQDDVEKRKQLSNEALQLFEIQAKARLELIESELQVLATIARHYLNVRMFAKLDGFVYTWPDIARLGMANYRGLEFVEECFKTRTIPSETDLNEREARELYKLCETNEHFQRFLRYRPHFKEINENDLRRYRPLAPVDLADHGQKSPAGSSIASVTTQPIINLRPPNFESFELKIDKIPSGVDPENSTHSVMLSFPGEGVMSHAVKLPTAKVLHKVLAAMGVTTENSLQSTLKELFANAAGAAEMRIARGGAELEREVFYPDMRKSFLERFKTTPPATEGNDPVSTGTRLVINTSDLDIHYLPWEWFPKPGLTEPALNHLDFSIVRGFTTPTDSVAAAIVPPIRLLSIMPTAPTGRRFNSAVTIKALQKLGSNELVEYKGLIRQEATLRGIVDQLENFHPHIVHFEGYVITPRIDRSANADAEPPDPSIVDLPGSGLKIALAKPDQGGMPLDEFGKLLHENGVQLLVIGRNGSSRVYNNAVVLGAFELIQQGLSAVIAPIRSIDESSATTFTAEFYRAFIEGNSIEGSLYVARRKLASKGGDWSVFALFADTSRLNNLQLLRETA